MAEQKCRHCGERITSLPGVDWNGQKVWTHQPVGASFMDSTHDYCHLLRAEPLEVSDADV